MKSPGKQQTNPNKTIWQGFDINKVKMAITGLVLKDYLIKDYRCSVHLRVPYLFSFAGNIFYIYDTLMKTLFFSHFNYL